MKNIIKNRSGVVLAEALMAVAMLSIGVVILSSIVSNAISATFISKNYLIAQNLVTEGIEAVKNIRDTNWVLYPDAKKCWLLVDPANPPGNLANCAQPGTRVNSNYRVRQLNGQWKLEFHISQLNLPAAAPDNFKLYVHPLFFQIGPDTVSYNKYVHDPVGTLSPFYRSVKFTQVDPDNLKATYEVKVQWKDGAKVNTISRTMTLFNYKFQ